MNRAFRRISVLRGLFVAATLVCVLGIMAYGADVHAPATVVAGQGLSIPLEGSGSATFYLLGPNHVVKRTVNLGTDLEVKSSDVQVAGRYQIIVCAQSCTSTSFEVTAAKPANLSFFLHPSRVPVSTPDSIDAFVFVFDPYFNLILTPADVNFRIRPANGAPSTRQLPTHQGVAWMRMASTSREGQVQVIAEIGGMEEPRVVQQVASDACGLNMKASHNGNMVEIETDPVRDCSGNPLPDGTIVSFTKTDATGRSTVDVPIKKGIARMQFRVNGPARLTIACGVALGNELSLSGKAL